MSQIRREIVLDATDGSFTSTMDRAGKSVEGAFEGANQQIERAMSNIDEVGDSVASKFSELERNSETIFSSMVQKTQEGTKSLSERLQYIQREIQMSERALRVDTERAKLSEKMKYQERIMDINDNGGSEAERQRARKEYIENVEDIDMDSQVKRQQLASVRSRFENYTKEERKRAEGEEHDQWGVDNAESNGGGRGMGGFAGGLLGSTVGALGFGALMSIGAFISKMIEEGKQLDEASSSVRGLGIRGGYGQGENYGMKDADYLQYQARVNQAAGSRSYNALGNLAFEKSYSQQLGSLDGLTGGLRTERGNRDASSVAREMLMIFKKSKLFDVDKGDFTQLAEKIRFSTEMMTQQGQQMYQTNATTNAQLLRAFGRARIDDSRTMDFSNPINQSITNPSNDFTKAFLYRALRKQNPNAGLFDLMKVQEQGIYGAGTFSSVMGSMKENFSGDMLKMNVMKMFGLKAWQTEKVLNMSDDDLKRIGTKEDIGKVGYGGGGAGVMSKLMAKYDNWFASKGEEAITKVGEYTSEYDKNGFGGLLAKMGSDITDAIKKGFESFSIFGKNADGSSKSIIDMILGTDDVNKSTESAQDFYKRTGKVMPDGSDPSNIENTVEGQNLAVASAKFQKVLAYVLAKDKQKYPDDMDDLGNKMAGYRSANGQHIYPKDDAETILSKHMNDKETVLLLQKIANNTATKVDIEKAANDYTKNY